jgi:serine protease
MARIVVLLTLGLSATLGCAACFEPEPAPPPPPTAQGTISGRILIDTAAGAVAADDIARADARARAAITAADNRDADTDTDVVVASAGDDAALANLTELIRRRPDLAPRYAEGDAIVHFKRGAYDRDSVAGALRRMRRDALADAPVLEKVAFTVNWCALKMFCLVKLTDDAGFLEEDATAAVVNALHKVRPPDMKQVMRNDIYQGFAIPNDPLFQQQWHLSSVNLPAAWELTVGDPDVVVAIVDSGVVHANPDLRGRITRDPQNPDRFIGADFVDVSISLDGDGPDLDAEDPGDNLFGTEPGQDSFHGTHTAGTVGAVTNNRLGVAGVMWEGQILPVRVLGDRLQGSVADILAGLGWAIGGEFDAFPRNQRPARIVNLSLGGTTTPSAQALWEDAVTFILDDPEGLFNDPILVCAAGNSAIDVRNVVPANIPRMITVGASRLDGQRANYSNFGPGIDVMAPGGQVDLDLDNNNIEDGVTSTLGIDVGIEQGTSMAAPHVAGIAGLIVSASPNLTHDLVHNLVRDTTNDALRCNEGCGSGLVDAAAALLASGAEVNPTPRLALNAQSIFFNGGIVQRTVSVLNLGSVAGPFEVRVDRGQAALFTVTPSSGTVPPSGLVTLTIQLARGDETVGSATLVVDGTGEADGQQLTAGISFDDNPTRGRRSLEEVQVGAFARAGDGGLVRVGEAIATRDNNFAFTVSGLTVGTYEVYAIGDDNFDGTFDSQQESVGAYPITTEVQPVVIEDEEVPVEGIDFAIRLRQATLATDDVGAACTDATKLTACAGISAYAPDPECIETFPGGYCSRRCDDNVCGANGICDELDCEGTPCNVCLQRCVSDSQCRTGYICVLDTCVPPGFDVPG